MITPTGPTSFADVLDAEYRALHGGASPVPPGAGPEVALRVLEKAALDAGHTALCLSGGGIRSASFSIGVLQGLARLGILDRFHYLSTVSGGGYAGGWWSAWRARAGDDDAVRAELAGVSSPPGEPEAVPVSEVRRLCRFLDPRVGLLSADVWTLGVTILRNLLLNWLVLVPLLAAGLLVPHLYLSILDLPSQRELIGPAALARLDAVLWVAGIVTLVASMAYIALDLPSLGDRRWSQRRFLGWFLVPVCLTEALLSISAAWRWITTCQHHSLLTTAAVSAAALAAPGLVGLAVGRRGWRPWTWAAVFVAGGVGGTLLWTVKARHLMAATVLATGSADCADALAASSAILPTYAALDLPVSLALLALEFMLLAGLSGRAMTDEDREWWARTCAWLLVVAVAWFVAGGLVLVAHAAIDRLLTAVAGYSLTGAGGKALLTIVTLLSGSAASRSGSRLTRRNPGRVHAVVFALAAPVFVVLLLVLLATIDESLLLRIEAWRLVTGEGPHPTGGGLVEVAGAPRRAARRRPRGRTAHLGEHLLAARHVPAAARADVRRRVAPRAGTPPEPLHGLRSVRRRPGGVAEGARRTAPRAQLHAESRAQFRAPGAGAEGCSVHDQPAARRVAGTRVSARGPVRAGVDARDGDDDLGRGRRTADGRSLGALPDLPAHALQRAPRRVARQPRPRRRRGPGRRATPGSARAACSARCSGRPACAIPTSISRTAAISRTSGSTRWSRGAAGRSWSSMPAAIRRTPSTISETRSAGSGSTSASRWTSPIARR